MSVDIIARVLVLAASPAPSTAEAIPTLRLATSVGVIQTSGYATPGIGAGIYVADGLANAALAAAHPRFCKADASGRYFRLLIPDDGLVPVACAGVAGTASPIHTSNHQPGLMAAILYSEAVGGKGISLEPKHYSVWVPNRTIANNDWSDLSGARGIPFAHTLALTVSFNGATLWRRAPLGADPTVAANWQIVAGTLWRGGSFFLQPRVAAAPANYADRAHLTLRGGFIMGGIPRGSIYSGASYATLAAPDCWDVNDKCIAQLPDQFNGTVTLTDMELDGFRGEMIYGTNDVTSALLIDRVKVSNTNAQPLNPNGTRLNARGFEAHTLGWALEGFGGEKGYLQGVIRNAAGGGFIQGGKPFPGTPYATPTRVVATEVPYFTVDLELRNCGTLNIGSWLRGKLAFTDCSFHIGNGGAVPSCYDVDLAISNTIDQSVTIQPYLSGTSNTALDMKTDNIRLDMTYLRTKVAALAGRKFMNPLAIYGSMGPNIIVRTFYQGGDITSPPIDGNPAATLDYNPRFEGDVFDQSWAATGAGTAVQNMETTPLLARRLPVTMLSKTTANATIVCTLPTTNLVAGHRIRLYSYEANGYFVFASSSNGGQIRGDGVVIRSSQFVDLEFDGYEWRVTRVPPPMQLTVATLPVAGAALKGLKAFVTDALTPAYGATAVTGGAVYTPVYCDGAAWKVG